MNNRLSDSIFFSICHCCFIFNDSSSLVLVMAMLVYFSKFFIYLMMY